MKKFLFLMVGMLFSLCVNAADGPKIEFEKTVHDFGNIGANDGRVTCEYEFTNTGDAPLLIVNVTNGGCGCTTPNFPKHPIKPGEKGTISITFNPKGRQGELNRTVRVTTNASKKSLKLQFKGVVIP